LRRQLDEIDKLKADMKSEIELKSVISGPTHTLGPITVDT
jgi:hypothetical protein